MTADDATTGPPIFSLDIHKTDAMVRLMQFCGLPARGVSLSEAAGVLARIVAKLPASANHGVDRVSARDIPDAVVLEFEPATKRSILPPHHATTRPDSFPASGIDVLHSPEFRLLSLPNGLAANFVETPGVFADPQTLVSDWGGGFRDLIRYYDLPVTETLRAARRVEGVALLMFDDIRPLNYCHWLIDWLPRLAALRTRPEWADASVITTPVIAEFQRESLHLCGFDDDRIIELGANEAVQVSQLLVPSDLSDIPHPGHKMAPWAVRFLRETIGATVMADFGVEAQDRKFYISRNDATGRRVTNEDALFARLEKAGYEYILPTNMTFAQQVALFASASHLIGPHGAGLTNLVFSAIGVQLIELLPSTYGMATFYAMTGGLDGRFHSFVTSDVQPGTWSQRDDMTIDMDAFERALGHLL